MSKKKHKTRMSKEQKAARQRPVVESTASKAAAAQRREMPQSNLKSHPFWFYLIMIAVIVAIDQCLKLLVENNIAVGAKVYIVEQYLVLTNVHNTGAAFSFLADQPQVVLGITSAIVAVGFYFLFVFRGNPLMQTFISLILGGANGNLLDRMTHGYVIDYIDINIIPVFNFADICVTVGTLFLCIVITALSRGGSRRG